MADRIWICDDEVSERFPVYTRANVGEVFTVAVSPLTWTVYGRYHWEPGFRESLYEMGVFRPDEFRPVGQCDVVGCFGGYIYLNVSVNRVIGVRTPGLTVEAIDVSFFGNQKSVPPYQPDTRDENPERSAQIEVWLASLTDHDPKKATNASRELIETVIAKRPESSTLSDAGLLDYFRRLGPHSQMLLKRHMLNTHGSNVMTGTVGLYCDNVGAGEMAARITAAIGEVESAGQSFDLWKISRQIRSSPVLEAAFDAGVDGLLERLRAHTHPDAALFLEQWETFIARWGFLGPDVWEFRSPTYRSHPEMVLRMLDRTRRAPDSVDPGKRSAQLASEREAAIAEVEKRLAGDASGRAYFTRAARAAASFLAARERSKVVNTRLNDEARWAMRELGLRLVERELLQKWEHVLLVTGEEADDFIADPASFSSAIAERASLLELLMGKEPPFVFGFKAPALSEFKDRGETRQPERSEVVRELKGIGVSPGRYTGRARIVSSFAADSLLEPGEVIVAVTTDSTWGGLFLAAGAVVVETGSTISHAAIVSRELGIPAAVSVSEATLRIADGAMVTVDGDSGTVFVH